jgi:hypothetical protein
VIGRQLALAGGRGLGGIGRWALGFCARRDGHVCRFGYAIGGRVWRVQGNCDSDARSTPRRRNRCGDARPHPRTAHEATDGSLRSSSGDERRLILVVRHVSDVTRSGRRFFAGGHGTVRTKLCALRRFEERLNRRARIRWFETSERSGQRNRRWERFCVESLCRARGDEHETWRDAPRARAAHLAEHLFEKRAKVPNAGHNTRREMNSPSGIEPHVLSPQARRSQLDDVCENRSAKLTDEGDRILSAERH